MCRRRSGRRQTRRPDNASAACMGVCTQRTETPVVCISCTTTRPACAPENACGQGRHHDACALTRIHRHAGGRFTARHSCARPHAPAPLSHGPHAPHGTHRTCTADARWTGRGNGRRRPGCAHSLTHARAHVGRDEATVGVVRDARGDQAGAYLIIRVDGAEAVAVFARIRRDGEEVAICRRSRPWVAGRISRRARRAVRVVHEIRLHVM